MRVEYILPSLSNLRLLETICLEFILNLFYVQNLYFLKMESKNYFKFIGTDVDFYNDQKKNYINNLNCDLKYFKDFCQNKSCASLF